MREERESLLSKLPDRVDRSWLAQVKRRVDALRSREELASLFAEDYLKGGTTGDVAARPGTYEVPVTGTYAFGH